MPSSRILAAWASTRLAMRRSPRALAHRRAALWRRMAPVLRATPALAPFAGRPLIEVPVTEIAAMRADYGRWNSLGCSHEQLHTAAASAEAGGSGEVRPGVVAGFSTGSGGTRGLFVADAAERADYIGQSLARLLRPADLLRPIRLALLLRANSRLYSDVGGRHFAFVHIPLTASTRDAADALAAFAPNILIAPSHRLIDLARDGVVLPGLRRIFYGAEPMSVAERGWIGDRFGIRPDPIYQATEGFIAAACVHGRLHLNEHALAIGLEPVAGTTGHRLIVTDLRRRCQPIVRVRMDDYVELDPHPCGCGYAGRTIRPVMGRVADIWRFADRMVVPGAIDTLLDDALALAPWQAIGSLGGIELRVDPAVPPDRARAAAAALAGAMPVPVRLSDAPPAPPAPKRQRMVWRDHG